MNNGRKHRPSNSPVAQERLRLRNEEIYRLWRWEGQSYRKIAPRFGLTPNMVGKIIREFTRGQEH